MVTSLVNDNSIPGRAPRTFELLGVPFDGGSTLGRPGSRYAPQRVREALGWITQRIQDGRIYSLEKNAIFDLGEGFLVDGGDVDVVPFDLEASMRVVSARVSDSVRAGRVPIVIGGDDSLLFPVVDGIHSATSGSLGVVHLDAHLDLLDHNPHQGKFSQSSGMRRSLELERVAPASCIQIASRHFNFPSSGEYKRHEGLAHMTVDEVQSRGPAAAVDAVLEHIGEVDHLHLSFDIDAIDPAFAPGSGAHEPGGLTSGEALEFVRQIAPHCASIAITEVNPMVDLAGATTTLAAYLAFHFAVHGSGAPAQTW